MGLLGQSRARVGAPCVLVLLALLATSGSAAAAAKPISGKLNKPGYTVIALAADGKGKSIRASRGRFKLRPPARRVTLQLRAPNGKYAGPIVVGRKKKGRRAIVGIRAGARLGRVRVRHGYARLARRLRKRWVDASRAARARRGVPIGTRAFGRVRSRPPRRSIPGDHDLDGIPDAFDIDDDGDLILDSFDRSRPARAAQDDEEASRLGVFSRLELGIQHTPNANHPALATQIDGALSSLGDLLVTPKGPGDELDCGRPQLRTDPSVGGLVYCSAGGTGRLVYGYPMGPLEFPECCDTEDPPDGFGTVTPDPPTVAGPPDPNTPTPMSLRHGARPDQIGTGDLLILLRASGGEASANLQFVFATTPALVSYDDDGPGGAPPTPVPYPISGPSSNPGGPPTPSGPGTQGNGLTVRARPNGHVVLTLEFWRPQRSRLDTDPKPKEGESAVWTDIGGGNYEVQIANMGFQCPQSAFSEDDPELTQSPGSRRLTDEALDRPANPANTFTYTVDLTECAESSGLGARFDEGGEQLQFTFGGRPANSVDFAGQTVFFRRQ
jgi:hypothetical protein